MKFLVFALFFFHFSFSQELEFVADFSIDADHFIAVDNFENYYFLKNNTLYKRTTTKTYSYSNIQLGEITSVDIKNPLKISLFYSHFNTVLFLDNQLNELTTPINFSASSFSKNIAFVNTASGTNLWLYSFDDGVLQNWNYQTKKIQFTTKPLSYFKDRFTPKQLLSTYKNCWLIGNTTILQFNTYGAFVRDYAIENAANIKLFKNGFIYLKKNQIYYQNDIETKELPLKAKITIRNFSMNGNQIYLFDGSQIFIYKILKF